MKGILSTLLIAIFSTIAITSCDSNGAQSDNNQNNNNGANSSGPLVPKIGEGYAQKGPFQNGATVLVEEFDDEGAPTGLTWSTTTQSDGKISFEGIGWEGLAMVTVTGHYFNEISGSYSAEPFALRAAMLVSDTERVGNVNLFTHIIARYIEYWMPDGYSYDELREYADSYFADWFGLLTPPEHLNLLDSIDANTDRDSYILLLYSAAMASLELTQEEVDQLADEFAQYDAGYYVDWPPGPGRTVLEKLFQEVQENEASLITQAREQLEQEFKRVISIGDIGTNRVAGTICIYAGVLCEGGMLEGVPVQASIPKDVPVNVLYSGSYGFLAYFEGNGQNANIAFSSQPGGTALRSASGSASSFIEIMVRPITGKARYNLRFTSSVDKMIERLSMFRLSDGLPKDPYPLVVGENSVQVGVVWGTDKNTDSYYQLIAGPGRYRFNISGYRCAVFDPPPIRVKGYEWDWDVRELPVEQAGNNPFDNSSAIVIEEATECFLQFELEADTRPNRLYVHVDATGLRDAAINSNRAISEEFKITVTRL